MAKTSKNLQKDNDERSRFRDHLSKLREEAYRKAKEFEKKYGKSEPIMKKVWADDYPVLIEW
ncbi:MAG: hypothetical protein QNJ31_08865 [Candidatus Caenarcaniphilales bacterium]|nr:hypothetical protein [Candidatus Caenarcaniphilales bacterium]